MAKILLADDDVELCKMLQEYLQAEGFTVDAAYDGNSALDKAQAEDYDLIVLDVMMPGKNGFDVLRALRVHHQTPVLMLTARGDDIDSVLGLELGADDYLGKPCNPRVLTARIRAVLRRAEPRAHDGDGTAGDILHVGDLTLNAGARSVRVGERAAVLTSTEFGVLETLLRDAGRAVSKANLSDRVLGRRLASFDRSLDMHVSNLRRKLGPLPDGDERIKTVRGLGYQYVVK